MSSRTQGPSWQRILSYSLVGLLGFQNTAWAELAGGIVTDGTMGATQALSGVNVTVPQSLGSTAGSNLFHSFSEFNIAPGQTVEFTGSNALQNVISRVTGTDVTNIEGTLKSSIANAAFYFINPNGITFGAGAQVNVPGAFHVSTADKIDFPNNAGAFYADSSQASTLSSEAPAAFGFLETSAVNNGLIEVNGAQLAVKTEQTLDVVAGEIVVKNYANISASSGEIRLVAMQSAGSVSLEQTVEGVLPLPLEQPSSTNGGRVVVDYSGIGAAGNGGGRISLWAGNTSLVNNSAVYADNEGDTDATSAKGIDVRSYALNVDASLVAFDAYFGAGKAGSVSVTTNNLDLLNGGAISSSSLSAGNAGTVQVVADTLRINRQNAHKQTGIASDALVGSGGDAGAVIVSAKNLEILNGGTISSDTLSSGNAGAILVNADTLRIDGQGGSMQTGIASDAVAGSSGDAGGVAVSAKSLDILSIGSISSNTWSTGNGGIVQVVADKLRIDGQGNHNAGTGIFSGIYSSESHSGNAGDLTVKAGTLDIFNGGVISSSTFSEGNAGRVSVEADFLNIDDHGFSFWQTGIFSKAEQSSTGHAGDLAVQAGEIDILNGGAISSSSLSAGNAGTVQVIADVLRINRLNANKQTGIASDALVGSGGDAGAVIVSAKNLEILNGGTISSDTLSSGNAGAILVNADTLRIDGQGGSMQTGIASDAVTGSSGDAGGVAVSAKSLDILSIGSISSNTWSTGNAGIVQVVADQLRIDGKDNYNAQTGIFSGVYSTEPHSGNAGDLSIQAGTLDIFNGGVISSATFSEGNAGTIQVAADTLLINGQGESKQTGIISDAIAGSSGNAGAVIVSAKNLDIMNRGSISSNALSSGNAGTLDIHTDTLDIVNSAKISSSTYAQGNAGSIDVKTNSLFIDGQHDFNQGGTGILSAANQGASGDSGDIRISADNMAITGLGGIFAESEAGAGGRLELTAKHIDLNNGGMITTTAFGTGHAGDIVIHDVHNIRIDGSDDNIPLELDGVKLQGMSSGIYLNSQGPGNGGSLNLQADHLILSDGGVISALATVGKGGNIDIHTRTTELTGGALISASTWGSGNAGVVNVSADEAISVSGHFDRNLHSTLTNYRESDQSSISGNATRAFTSPTVDLGAGGSVTVSAPLLTLADGGEINVSTEGAEKAGFVKVEAGTLAIVGNNSAISAEAKAGSGGQTGDVVVNASVGVRLFDNGKISIENGGNPDNPATITPGSIAITAPTIDMKGSEITSNSTGNVAAGNIVLNFSGRLTMEPSFISTTANTGNGGSITINGGEVIYLQDSGFRTTVSGADSNGGDIFTQADILVMNTGLIQANAVGGSGGNINLNLSSLIPSGNTLIKGGSTIAWQPFQPGFNVIQAASQAGVSGVVNVTAPQLNLSGILANLGGPQFDTSIISQDYCGLGTGSSLTRKGSGGLQPKSGDQLLF